MAKSLLNRISALPFRNPFRRTLLIVDEADRFRSDSGGSALAPSAWAFARILEAIDGLMEIIKRERSSLREPMIQLSASAEALAAMAKAMSERPAEAPPVAGEELKTAIDRLTARIEQLGERPAEAPPVAGEELKTAIDRLTAKIEQLGQRPAEAVQSELRGYLEEVRDFLKEFD